MRRCASGWPEPVSKHRRPDEENRIMFHFFPPVRSLGRIGGAILTLLVASSSVWAQKPASPDPLEQVNQSIDALTKKVWPSVVQILVTSYGAREEGLRGETNVVVGRQRSMGSGFVIDPTGTT